MGKSNDRWLDAFQSQAWALRPAKLEEVNAFICSRIEGGITSQDLDALKADAAPAGTDNLLYGIIDGVAVISMVGVLSKRLNMLSAFSGGVSAELLVRDLKHAAANEDVAAILLDIDSPGGSVNGTKEVADAVLSARAQKPVVAYISGMGASAAYWIATAADHIVALDTAIVGSVGVAMTHFDYSGRDKQQGVTRTEIYAGKYKRIASDTKPLTDEGKAYLQAIVDEYYSIFVNTVAENRGMSPEDVLSKIADGQEFIGAQALDVGAIDQVGGLETAITMAITLADERSTNMDVATLKEKHPDVYQAVFKAGAESVDIKALVASAKNDEGSRVLSLVKAHVGDEEGAKIEALVASGVTVDQYKAVLALQRPAAPPAPPAPPAGSSQQAAMLAAIQAAGHGINPGSDGGAGSQGNKDFMALVAEYQAIHKCKKSEAMKAIAATNPGAHETWVMGQQKGAATVH